jgi:glutathione S-transferase
LRNEEEPSMLKIWGRLSSINVQKVVWCANELGLRYERVNAGLAYGVVDSPEYLQLNPNGMVPCIADDGFVLWESNAIVRYLAAKHGSGSLSPQPLAERADADRWMDWQCTELSPKMRDAFIQCVRTPEAQRDTAAAERSARATLPLLQILDAQLAGRSFVCGAGFTMADIPLGCATHRWFGLPVAHGELPNVRAWYERLMQRPAVQDVLTLPLE